MQRITVLGATGSIGHSTLDVVARHSDRYRVEALTAHRDDAALLALCRTHRPRRAVLVDREAAARLRRACDEDGLAVEVLDGAPALAEVAASPASDAVMSAIVGAAGLLPTLAAVRAGKRVMIANKEPLVMAGRLLMREAQASAATLLPIDSEHNAIFQCLPSAYRCGSAPPGVRRLILTASGGPFRDWDAARLAAATPEQAVRHPNWVMGRKISVDSATLMNKGLELIEAATLYGLAETAVDVVVHPESAVHSLVEYVDGSMLAQLGQPDMRVPIAHALAWPARIDSGVGGLDLAALGALRFEAPDTARFPCLRLAREALRAGGAAANVLNAANEIAVQAFLDGRIGFAGIATLIEDCVVAGQGRGDVGDDDLDGILATDAWARRWCEARLPRATAAVTTATSA